MSAVGPAADSKLLGREVVINPGLDWGTDERVPVAAVPHPRLAGRRHLRRDGEGAGVGRVREAGRVVVGRGGGLATRGVDGLSSRRHAGSGQEGRSGAGHRYRRRRIAIRGADCPGLRRGDGGRDLRKRRQAALAKQHLGVDGGASYRTGDWAKEIVRLCDGVGPDVVIDSVGGETLGKAIDIARPGAAAGHLRGDDGAGTAGRGPADFLETVEPAGFDHGYAERVRGDVGPA